MDITWTYTRERGRQFASMSRTGESWNYTYDADGLRIGRTDGTNTYQYIYAGDKLVRMIYNGEVVDISYAGNRALTYGYDGLRRLSTVSGGIYSKAYTYRDITATQTTNQVASVTYDLPTDQNFVYTYDPMGNILTYTDANGTVTYAYDGQGQLLGADVDGDKVNDYVYTYDNAGNILTANGHTYTYGDNKGWADLLTKYDGQQITYDAIGNPLSYFNGTRWEFTWTQGRQLTQAFTTSGTEDVTIAYTYDADGLRTSKTVVTGAHTHNYTSTVVAPTCTAQGYTSHECCCGNSYVSNYLNALGHKFTDKLGRPVDYCIRCGASNIILPPGPTDPGPEIMSSEALASTVTETSIPTTVTAYEYIYAGTKLIRMIVTTTVDDGTPTVQTLDFAYDASGMPVTVTTGGNTYYYITNLQGDVMAIVGGNGTVVASYEYDPYGNMIDATGNLSELNPLTYRGYVYDRETKFFYLQSRYYDPELGRFINADAYASTGQGILGNNMFAYCGNNPATTVDPSGNAWCKISFDAFSPFDSSAVPMAGGGGGFMGAVFAMNSADSEIDQAIDEFDRYVNNTSEATVLNADYYAFYKGALVIKLPLTGIFDGASASFGIIIMDNDLGYDDNAVNLLRHEYGHFQHLLDIGLPAYITTVAIPSASFYLLKELDVYHGHYYSLPWEYIADRYGGATRSLYSSGADVYANIYWVYSYIVGVAL